MRPSTA
jgi:NIMA (never in mitosis gene a)-related kinase